MKPPPSALKALFDRRVRGFRVVELGGMACLVALVFGVYCSKAGAGVEGAQIADTTRQIAAEERRLRALKAELARLETPGRLERLSVQYLGLQPVSGAREADAAGVGDLARASESARR